jgi:hypothetical protein
MVFLPVSAVGLVSATAAPCRCRPGGGVARRPLAAAGAVFASVDAYLAVVSKRVVSDYAARPVGADAARRIREAGRIAGSSKTRLSRELAEAGARG